MSVAIGIPAPDWVLVPKFKSKNKPAGTNIPPSAPDIGNNALLILESSPAYISRSNSNPINKKKIVINPSLIQCSRELFPNWVCQN